MSKCEQIDKGEWCKNYKKWLKRELRRLRRRLEKKYLENAPIKISYHGWSL